MCYRIVYNPLFEIIIDLFIVLNIIVYCFDQYPYPSIFILNIGDLTIEICEIINFIISIILLIEVLLKFIALGPIYFIRDMYDVVDVIVFISIIIEFIIIGIESNIEAIFMTLSIYYLVATLKTIRLLRIIKLTKVWYRFHEIITVIKNSVLDLLNFVLLLLLYIFIESLIGMFLFADKFHFDPVTHRPIELGDPRYAKYSIIPRNNYDSFARSALCVFQYLAVDGFHLILYDQIRTRGWIGEIYGYNLIVIGNMIILNLFLAVLLGKFKNKHLMVMPKPRKSYLLFVYKYYYY